MFQCINFGWIKFGIRINSAGINNLGRSQFKFDLAHVKSGVWTGPKVWLRFRELGFLFSEYAWLLCYLTVKVICHGHGLHLYKISLLLIQCNSLIILTVCFYLKLARCIERLSRFAEKCKSIPTLGYTHFQWVLSWIRKRNIFSILYSSTCSVKRSDCESYYNVNIAF